MSLLLLFPEVSLPISLGICAKPRTNTSDWNKDALKDYLCTAKSESPWWNEFATMAKDSMIKHAILKK